MTEFFVITRAAGYTAPAHKGHNRPEIFHNTHLHFVMNSAGHFFAYSYLEEAAAHALAAKAEAEWNTMGNQDRYTYLAANFKRERRQCLPSSRKASEII